ncbi:MULTISPECIES: LysR family transcriptional regulator [unclassified Rhizobium]|uniref:LysR family transcriptional regulator n=1 Tax=unclassified Rhizobium TaxID=2613769 RepID=UPI000BD87996|nr:MULTISPECIES: LysR family transcriptional regulator [unclassified Rhizobium]MDH7808660.1 DNA-binding transcriptional LysR family regulator [Rhizobium sp. AN67]MDQ4408845.1 LysR family transcriptional regulator [Rhizobium sp. AN63]SOD50769.1 DNA-binding transcriptional regulator, LysR family [Rhizobium sp. AN6A]
MPNLLGETSGMTAFVRTVEAGSFTAAARDLGTTPSAVSKSVARLERKIGTRLFLRSTRALTLTQDGQVFFERVAPLLRELDASDDAIRSQAGPAGRLRISMPGELAPLLLPQLFSNFAKSYPDLQLDIGLTDRFVNLVREDYDVALRAGTPLQEDLIVRRLAYLPMIVVASPAFVETWGHPKFMADLAALPFVRYAMSGEVKSVRLADGTVFVPKGRVDCDTGIAMIEAARSGLGAAYLLRCLLTDELRAGTLVDLAPDIALPKLSLSALHAFGRTVPTRVRLFCDFMASEAKILADL